MALQERREHEIILRRRKEMNVVGVKDIDSFDEKSVVLETTDGTLVVEGETLKMGELDTEKGVGKGEKNCKQERDSGQNENRN